MLTPTRKGLTEFYFKPASLKRMALFRVSIGLFALIQLLSLAPEWYSFYGNYGWVEWVVSKEIYSKPHVPHLWPVAKFLDGLGVSEPAVTYSAGILYGIALVAIVLGWRTRIFAVVAWFLHLITCNSGPAHGYGVESFTHVALFYLIFFPTTEFYSLHRRSRKDEPEERPLESAYAGLCFRVLQVHLCVVYLASGLAKIMGSDWITGTAMWEILAPPTYGGESLANTLSKIPWVTVSMSWLILALECLYPVCIWLRRTRTAWLIAIIMMHLGISLFMRLYLFGGIMILLNVFAFSPLLTNLWQRLSRKEPSAT